MRTMMPSSLAKQSTPTPSIIILRTAEMYQRAGMKSGIQRNTAGMLSMGNIRPEKISVGIINPMPDNSNAAICELTKADIISPNAKATSTNRADTTASQNRLPRIGTSIKNTAKSRMVTMLVTDNTK